MKISVVALTFLISTQVLAYSDNVNTEIMLLDKPYTITHLKDLGMDCVWTRGDKGYLNSEAMPPDGPGMCWDGKAIDQAEKLDKERKLVWHNPPSFDYEYGDKNKCYYRVDKTYGFVDSRVGNNVTGKEADACGTEAAKATALKLATKVKKEAEPSDIQKLTLAQINGCYAGLHGTLKGDWPTQMTNYAKAISQYTGNGGAIDRISRAFNYGKSLANTPDDCVSFVTNLH